MSEDQVKNEDSIKRPDGYDQTGKVKEETRLGAEGEPGMDDRAAEFVFKVFREQNAEGDSSAAVGQWTAFLSACKTEWILSSTEDRDNPDPAIRIAKAGMIHTGMRIRTQDIWLDVQDEYTAERGEYLNRFSGRMNNLFFGFETGHPTLLVGPVPAGEGPLDEILKQADDRMYSFQWLDGTHFRAIPCIDRDGSLLICDLKNMDKVDVKKTNAALMWAGGIVR